MLRILASVSLLFAVAAPLQAASKPYKDSASQTAPAPPADKAQIIFLEPINRSRALYPVAIYELHDGKRTLVGVTSYKSKTIVNLEPGKHQLMATQGFKIAHLMEANVEAGKRYYVLVRFFYMQGMPLQPVHTAGPSDFRVDISEFPQWQAETRFIELTADEDHFFSGEQLRKIEEGLSEALQDWTQKKTPRERADLTLNPEDASLK